MTTPWFARSSARGTALAVLVPLALGSCLLPELTKRSSDEGAAGSDSSGGNNGSSGSKGNGGKSTGGDTSLPDGGDGGPSAGTTSGMSGNATGGTAQAGSSPGGGTPNGGTGGTDGTSGTDGSGGDGSTLAHFSFFVTSLAAMQALSGSQEGFGGDLSYGQVSGLVGADKICSEIAERSMAGSSSKKWHAFLSAATGPTHAKNRIGTGPWYDRLGRLVATDLAQLLGERPGDANAAIKNDLPNEDGVPNHAPDGATAVDNQAVLTGSDTAGMLYSANSTCTNWTSTAAVAGKPRVGAAWPLSANKNWMSTYDETGCGPGVVLVQQGGPNPANPSVGSGGGYGAIYCFAIDP